MNPTKTKAIRTFLEHATHSDLAGLYNHNMECQVNVAQDNGVKVEGEFKGKAWHGWTDDLTTWKSFRIPYNASTNPTYDDKEITFDLAAHAEGIGMTGWDWYNKQSLWVAYDYDAIIGHSEKHIKKLSEYEFEELEEKVKDIDWVTLRLSTSGKGRHLYVFLEPIETQNHSEHAALARAILGLLSSITGYDFNNKVDVQGGNMWVYHRKMVGTDGLKLIKKGTILKDIPFNWQEHIPIVIGKAKRTIPAFLENDQELIDIFDELSGQNSYVPLESSHLKLMEWIRERHLQSWWDQDRRMLVTHTAYLAKAHEELNLKGPFKTIAQGTEYGTDYNCFMHPLRKGAWVVRRYGLGVSEADTWSQDPKGWTRCWYNRDPDFDTACRAMGGILDAKNGYVFTEAEFALQATNLLGVNLSIAPYAMGRQCVLRRTKDDKLIVEIPKEDKDDTGKMKGWLQEKKNWQKVFPANLRQINENEAQNFDDIIRHLITDDDKNYGWVVKSEGTWKTEPLEHVKLVLEALSQSPKDNKISLGACVLKSWRIVNRPFQPEYPEGRVWNHNAAQLAYAPNLSDDRSFPTWLKILNHIGLNLNDAILEHPWAKTNGITTGADYLKCWIASMIQFPMEHLPYLFLFGPEDSGKSILHEAIGLLLTRGKVFADNALISQSGFNAEIEEAVLCVVEETDLSARSRMTLNRIKAWVTGEDLPIHRKNFTPYAIRNSTHWIQTANDKNFCPVFPGDSRITMIKVGELSEKIPKRKLIEQLKKESPDFLGELMTLELPEPIDRLNIPIIETKEKIEIQQSNMSELEQFVKEHIFNIPGSQIQLSEFADRFWNWLPKGEQGNWSKIKISRSLPEPFKTGRSTKDNYVNIINASWSEETVPRHNLIIDKGGLIRDETSAIANGRR